MSRKLVETSIILLIVLLVVTALVLALRSGDDQPPAPPTAGEHADLLQYIPADTPLLMIGRNTPESLKASEPYLRRLNIQEMLLFTDLLKEMLEGGESSMFLWLLEDYMRTATAGSDALGQRYGLDLLGTFAIYIHGAAPVFRGSLSDPAALDALLAEAAAQTGTTPRAETLADGSALQVWPALPEFGIELALATENNTLTVSLIHPSDTDQARLERFARLTVAESLVHSDTLHRLRAHYADPDLFLGYQDIHRITEALLLPQQSSTGRELTLWFPMIEEKMTEGLSMACRRDFVELAGQIPRLSFGGQYLTVEGDRVEQGLSTLWDIENARVLASLQKLQGFIPNYARQADNKLFAMALGLDMSQLIPVSTELWTQFTQAQFECEQLQEMQQTAQGFNPAMLAMMGVGMVESLRGAGFALYSLNADASTPEELVGSLLISFSAENPGALASMAAMFIPQLQGVSIPPDGTPVTLGGLPGLGNMEAAIKGKHLVLYRGEAATRDANAIVSEALEKSGLSSMTFNTSGAEDWVNLIENHVPGNCSEMMASMLDLSQVPMQFVWGQHYNDWGWAWDLDFDLSILPPVSADDLAGRFQVSQLLDDECRWLTTGRATLNADGTGEQLGRSSNDGCDDHRSEFRWALGGSLLEREVSAEYQRRDCAADWAPLHETRDSACMVLLESNTGFYCVNRPSLLETEIYRYDRLY